MEPIHEYVLYTDAIKVLSQNLALAAQLFDRISCTSYYLIS